MGIETNFGKYLGKMDIISSLATLSFDKRRSEFFTNELIIVLNLIDKKIINKNTLFGSWAGAFEIFNSCHQLFKPMQLTNKNLTLNLKNRDLLHQQLIILKRLVGKEMSQAYKVELKENIPEKYLNSSAQKKKK